MGLLCVAEMSTRNIVELVLIRQLKMFRHVAHIIKLQSFGMMNVCCSTQTIVSLAKLTTRTHTSLNRQNVKDPTMFDQKVATLFAELPWKVSHSATNYASGKFNLDKSKKIYWLAQCALYLSQEYCGKCIQYSIWALQRVCHGRQGGYLPVTVQR